MVLVDSSIWIESGRRQGRLDVKVALEALLDAYEAMWCGVVKLEVLGRARMSERRTLDFFFRTVPYKNTTEATIESAKRLSWQLRDAGLTVPANDVLVAALAIEAGARVYSCDAHFEAMAAHIPLHLYTPGYGGSFDPGDG
jgi:predicted nucleic acid-binding protein